MTPEESLRFLAMLGVEYAQRFAESKQPAVQETLLMRIDAATKTVRHAIKGEGDGNSQA